MRKGGRNRPPFRYSLTLRSAFPGTAGAAFAAFGARLTAAFAADNINFRSARRFGRFRFTLLLHRAGILVLAAGAAHHAYAVFAAAH